MSQSLNETATILEYWNIYLFIYLGAMKIQVGFGKCWLYSYTNSCFNITIEKSLPLQKS